MALESAAACSIPARACWLRALLLERERVANHLGDLGALGNDAALAFGLSQFSRLREDWLRLSKEVFGHRLMMDSVVPGGTGLALREIVHGSCRDKGGVAGRNGDGRGLRRQNLLSPRRLFGPHPAPAGQWD